MTATAAFKDERKPNVVLTMDYDTATYLCSLLGRMCGSVQMGLDLYYALDKLGLSHAESYSAISYIPKIK